MHHCHANSSRFSAPRAVETPPTAKHTRVARPPPRCCGSDTRARPRRGAGPRAGAYHGGLSVCSRAAGAQCRRMGHDSISSSRWPIRDKESAKGVLSSCASYRLWAGMPVWEGLGCIQARLGGGAACCSITRIPRSGRRCVSSSSFGAAHVSPAFAHRASAAGRLCNPTIDSSCESPC